ncbi:MAG TPA: hypothetical protein VG248_03580 [Caulobacteraceae bacterium]|jgi:hypothetical protein|nr:hypothetical protein [Caulobacteraceae bacterium]
MNARSVPGNRHVVDLRADVRAQIKDLQKVEENLKAEISRLMGSDDSLGGDEWIASQTLSTRKGAIDEAKATAAGVDLNAFRKPAV